MMAGSRDLRKLQLGQEGTAGTAVAASAIWRGMGTIKDERTVEFVEEDVAIIGGTTRNVETSEWGTLTMDSVGATFEQLMYPFAAGVEDVTTGAADGAGSGKIYQYDASTTAQNSIQTFTIEGGDDTQAEEFDYCFVQKITLTGEGQGQLMVASDWIGRAVTNTTFTGALSIPTVEDVIFNSGKLYIDNSGGTVGSTQVSGLLRSATLDWTTGYIPYWTVDGSKEFTSHKLAGRTEEIVLSMQYEHVAAAVTEKAYYRDQSIRLIQLLFEGTALGTPGTTYTYKSLVVNLAGIYTGWEKLGEVDGNDIVEVEFTARYSSTDSLKAQAIIVNEVASVP
jgi:hypothetical protein